MKNQVIENKEKFFISDGLSQGQEAALESSRGGLLIASCRSGTYMASSVVKAYQKQLGNLHLTSPVSYLPDINYRFSDTETGVRLEADVSGRDVFLFQALYDPTLDHKVDQNYMAFLIAVRTFCEWGANHITGVLPYLAYARQDKPTRSQREPTTARLMADLSVEAGLDRLVVWHSHYPQIQGFYGKIPVDKLDPLPFFVEEFRRFRQREDVIVVAPDAGASKLVTYFSRTLQLKSAIASKYRPNPGEAVVSEIVGDFRGKKVAIVLDDMISSGGTLEALVKRLVSEKGIEEIYLGVSHNLCTPQALERLRLLHEKYNLKEMIVTNTIPQTEEVQALPFVSVKSLAHILSRVVNRIHYNRPVSDLFHLEEDGLREEPIPAAQIVEPAAR